MRRSALILANLPEDYYELAGICLSSSLSPKCVRSWRDVFKFRGQEIGILIIVGDSEWVGISEDTLLEAKTLLNARKIIHFTTDLTLISQPTSQAPIWYPLQPFHIMQVKQLLALALADSTKEGQKVTSDYSVALAEISDQAYQVGRERSSFIHGYN